MSKRESSKYKIDRRLGVNLWGRPKSPVNRRDYGPGQHGQTGKRKKVSDFGLHLRAKQKLKGYYGSITEKQFRRIYGEAVRRRGDTSENLIGLLESRLGAVVEPMRQVPTPFGRSSPIHVLRHGQVEFAVLSRHGEESYSVSAASVEERANIWALKGMGVEKIVSFDAVGSLSETAVLRGGTGRVATNTAEATRNAPDRIRAIRGAPDIQIST